MTAPDKTAGSGPRIAIVDDDTVIRHGLALLLPAIDVAGAYRDTESLLAIRPAVDVVLLDLNLQGTGRAGVRQGADAVRAVRGADYRVCVYTNERRRHVLVGCLIAGAQGIVHKAEPLLALSAAVDEIAAGEVVITQALVGLAELADRQSALPKLSDRQRQVLSGRARGESFQSIANRLHVTRRTAEEHMSIVTAKFASYLQTHSAADLERMLGFDDGELLTWETPIR